MASIEVVMEVVYCKPDAWSSMLPIGLGPQCKVHQVIFVLHWVSWQLFVYQFVYSFSSSPRTTWHCWAINISYGWGRSYLSSPWCNHSWRRPRWSSLYYDVYHRCLYRYMNKGQLSGKFTGLGGKNWSVSDRMQYFFIQSWWNMNKMSPERVWDIVKYLF